MDQQTLDFIIQQSHPDWPGQKIGCGEVSDADLLEIQGALETKFERTAKVMHWSGDIICNPGIRVFWNAPEK